MLFALYLLSAISVLGHTRASGLLFTLHASAVCLVYGGVVSLFPVVVSDHFGTRHQGTNYGAVMIGYGLASILCPFLLNLAGQELSLVIAGAASAAGLLLLRFF